ncbi:hypothetical protein QJQ45_003699 [Haematococcus lacustris]|nr:hypothetical protein QJQ45_003699 [Haematococcus lacustris]
MNTPPAPYSLRLDPETARELATVGAALLLLDVPVGTLIGIDQQCFAAGPLFKGVKMLPPGPHFITYSAVSAHTASASPATGFFLHALPHAVYVKRWSSTTESLEALPEAEAERFAAGVRRFDFDSGMAPYNLHGLAAWSELCSCLTPELVDRLVPVSGVISVACEAAELDLSQPKTPAEQRLADQLLRRHKPTQPEEQQQQQEAGGVGHGMAWEPSHEAPEGPGFFPHPQDMPQPAPQCGGGERVQPSWQELQPQPQDLSSRGSTAVAPPCPPPATHSSASQRSGRCFYSHLPRFIKPLGADAQHLTHLNLDKSHLLNQVLQEQYQGQLEQLLGELQFAFIAFVFGQSLDAYAQWKRLLLLLLGCEHVALHTHQPHFAKFLRCVRWQLRATQEVPQPALAGGGQAPQPFGVSLVDELLPDSFLRRMFGHFFSMLQENGTAVGHDLFHEVVQLKALLRQQLGWEYDMQQLDRGLAAGQVAEDDEDGPVVVEQGEELLRL